MTHPARKLFAALGLAGAVAASASLSLTTDARRTEAWSSLGHTLSITQRDFRVNNNFTDTQANNNTTPHVNYPGHTGAVMAIWKAVAEWGSGGRGDGSGDPVSGNFLGSGGANFDGIFQGTTTSTSSFTNIHRELSGSSGSTFAFMQGGGSGWHVRYYSTWTWQDGPGSIGGGADLQGIGCHEHGHSLGLGHSNAGGSPTMQAGTANGQEQRSINGDDQTGIQAIYGAADPAKPNITSISGVFELGSTLTINGTNFSATNNEVWFTKALSDGVPSKVFGVPSNGTVITVTIPGNAVDGDVMVRKNATGHASLSDAYPLNIDSGGPQPPVVAAVTPDEGQNFGWTEVAITGIGLLDASDVEFGGVDALSFNVVHDGLIEAVTPGGTLHDVVDVTVTNDDGSHTLPNAFEYGFNSPIDIDAIDPVSGPSTGGQLVTFTGPNTVPVYYAQFDGVEALNLEIISANEFTVETPGGAAGTVDVLAHGFGDDVLVDAYTYNDVGQFNDIGPGLGGALGVPILSGIGDLTPGGAGFTLNVLDAPHSAAGSWFIGLTNNPVPFKGGFIYPVPWAVQVAIITGGDGTMVIPGVVDVSIPSGISAYMQMWFQDATGPLGFTCTNGLELVIP